ncbi:helix-turn-helix transcriptional regulator [Citricoccus sp. SGAir0253]|uniref:helix-turn-helix transcriptional regulator n=1 Tax=Citricoccus sp. SGAir0253 TaxID=2567881 RepID=UPI0010CD1E81|nr:LuxR family transcriptional regulator [Citricoccus sp. SGAir0253]QCU78179.1 helix-turn-helix transcriptional regulator [Citricoccus sp. SGAir0253]
MSSGALDGDPAHEQPLVGRDAVFAHLEETLREVRRGHVRTVVLTGPAGSGKTAVLEVFLQHCRQLLRGVRVLSAVGDPWERQLALAGYSQLMQTAPIRSAKAYDAGAVPSSAPVPELTPAQAAAHAATFMTHLEALQAKATVVVAIDDVHHLDEETLRILVFVLRRLRGKRVLFVLTLDSAGAQGLPAGLLGALNGHRAGRLQLDPLTAGEVQDLARRDFGLDLGTTAAQRLVAHTRGWPQPIVELLGELPPETWQSWFPSLPASSRMVAQVSGLLAAGSPELTAVVEAVAVLGDQAGPEETGRVSGVGSVMQALDEAHRAGLVRLRSDEARSVVDFVEPGAAEAVYDLVPPSRRLALHRRAAEVVADEGQRLAHRVAATLGADEDLARELEEFARRQARRGAWHDVSNALFAAARLSPDGTDRGDRVLRAVDALVGSGSIAEAQVWTAAVESMPASPLRSSVLGYLSTASGQNHSARTQLTQAWEASDPATDPEAAAQVAQRLVLHGLASWDGPAMTRWAETAMSLTPAGAPAHVESAAIYGLGLYAQGRLHEAEAAYEEALGLAGETAQKQRLQMGAAWLALRADDVEHALVNFEAATPTEPRGGSLRISLWAEAWLARTQLILGDWDAAAITVSRASSRLEASRMPLVGPLLYWTAAELWSMRGDWARARQYVSRAAVHPGSYAAMQVPSHLARARFHEARADYESALEALEPLTEIDPWTPERVSFWPWQDTYVNALVMTNRLDRAAAFLRDLEAVPRERAIPTDEARLAWARGRLVAAQGDPDSAREHFERALLHLRGLHRPYLRARISFAFGQSMRRAGKRRLASSVLQVARDLYDALGATTYVDRCDRELKATGMDTSGVEDPADPVLAVVGRAESELTAQELAVAELVAAGATNKEAARSLFLAEKTVQYHLTRIYRKLGIRSRSELAARYRRGE